MIRATPMYLIRPEVRNFQPYLPGKPIAEVQRELGLKRVVKLASNENALGASPKAVQSLRKNSQNVFRYPEGAGTLLRRALARKLGVRESEVILGAGSDEIIEILGKTFFNREDEIVVSQHAFIRYKMAADLLGAKTIEAPMKNQTHDLQAMFRNVNRRTKALFVANPNNPTGTYVNRQEVELFFSNFKPGQVSPFLIFDEAYYEYSKELAPDYPDLLNYFRKGYPVVVLRTFSKIYGLAGLRVGYGVAPQWVVEAMDRVRPPFNVSSLAQSAAIACLNDRAHIQKSLAIVREGLDYLTQEMRRLGLPTIPSVGNFLMVSVSPLLGKNLFQKLLRKGVIVRAMDEYGFPNHIRVTVGLPQENRFFVHCLKEVL
ncbi:MAG: histidinol-phosphate transaminase [Elusimicrobia bacterium]|nr:histidinol-phosphate transaminase [Elusimicrobiota bacterium]